MVMSIKRNEEYRSHPAYAQVSFSRVTGHFGKLYGSALSSHASAIMLRIAPSSVRHDLGQNWYCAEPTPYIEVYLSAAQFAELLTTMNAGQGTCCTVRQLRGEDVPPMPKDEQIEHERVMDAFKRDVSGLVDYLKAAQAEVGALLTSGKTVTAVDKKRIQAILAKTLMEVQSNAPFMVEQFQEAAEKVVTAGKAEMDAVVTHMVTKLGLEQLQAGRLSAERQRQEALDKLPPFDEIVKAGK